MEHVHVIIKELKQKNYQHFDEFYHLTKQQVFFAVIGIVKDQSLAEDLLQETYMKFLEKIDSFKEGSNPSAYLTSIARNLAIDLYHKRKKEVLSDELMDMIPSEEVEDEKSEEIFKLLDLLEPLEKEIIIMHVINDLKFREISKILNKPLGTVLWIYNKAIKKMKMEVGEFNDK